MSNLIHFLISNLFPDEAIVEPVQIRVTDSSASIYGGEDMQEGDSLWEYSRQFGRVTLEPIPAHSAEDWITKRGFGSVRLVTLLDLDAKLRALTLTSPKMNATRQWLDGITLAYASNPTPRYVWPSEPHPFDEVVQEAMGLLTQST